tara:strand:+ start:310 stop:531 length:222 start_codon:yes stop_codon:yes gene_type:complete
MSKLAVGGNFVGGLLLGGLVTFIIIVVIVKIHLGDATICTKDYNDREDKEYVICSDRTQDANSYIIRLSELLN